MYMDKYYLSVKINHISKKMQNKHNNKTNTNMQASTDDRAVQTEESTNYTK